MNPKSFKKSMLFRIDLKDTTTIKDVLKMKEALRNVGFKVTLKDKSVYLTSLEVGTTIDITVVLEYLQGYTVVITTDIYTKEEN